jgi:nanoRNase/pAp phosphatase (c-di-AMP/oligoRNAs hydrolase)
VLHPIGIETMRSTARTIRKLRDLRKRLNGKRSLLIVLQDNPDPDALAAAAALRKLANVIANLSCTLASGGEIGRGENRALARYMELNLRPSLQIEAERFDLLALVDTQPGHTNTTFPPGGRADIIIDHHPRSLQCRGTPFTDIRSRYGATSTILYEYLRAARIAIEPSLATGLLYGIRSDTQDLGRDTTQADIDAYESLYRRANKRALGVIQRGQAPTEYFRVLAEALVRAYLCRPCIYAALGRVDSPDIISEVSDLLLRHEEVSWSLCWGYCGRKMYLSLRTESDQQRADDVLRQIIAPKGSGGGHRTMAGGQIDLPDEVDSAYCRRLDGRIRRRFLQAVGARPADCQKLL